MDEWVVSTVLYGSTTAEDICNMKLVHYHARWKYPMDCLLRYLPMAIPMIKNFLSNRLLPVWQVHVYKCSRNFYQLISRETLLNVDHPGPWRKIESCMVCLNLVIWCIHCWSWSFNPKKLNDKITQFLFIKLTGYLPVVQGICWTLILFS